MSVVGYISADWMRSRIETLAPQHFDAVITVVSWEKRCHSILAWNGLTCNNSLILRFAGTPLEDPEKEILKGENFEILKAGMTTRSSSLNILDLPKSTAMAQAFHKVGAAIGEIAGESPRRLRMCVDASSMPRSLICYLILCSFKQMLTDHISFFFSISDHGESVDLVATEGLAGLATRAPYVEGKWELMSVPYGEGRIP